MWGKMMGQKTTAGKLITQMVLLMVICITLLWAADDVKIKLTDTGGVSNFAVQNSSATTVLRVDSQGNTHLLNGAQLKLWNTGNTNFTGFKAPALTLDLMLTLPASAGSNGSVLTTNGAGTLSWGSAEHTLTFNLPLTRTADTISLPVATASANGYLSSGDWTTFNGKEPAITAGTAAQYWRGDKTWQTLNATAVGLGNVANSLQLVAANNLLDLTNAATARTNLGLGTMAVVNSPVPIANGGTGATAQTAAFDALAPTTIKGDIIVDNGVDAVRQAVGANNTVLTADSTQATGVKWAVPILSYVTSTLGSDVNMSTAGTWYTGTSVSLAAGTYLVTAHITMGKASTTADVVYARITNGTNYYASGQALNPATNPHATTITMTTIVILGATTTISVQGTSSVANGLIKAALTANGVGNNATEITAVQIK